MEYSRNLIFEVGGRMDQVFQALIDRSRALLDLKTIKTILGDKGRPKYRPRNMRAAESGKSRSKRPTYDLATVFKLHCGKLVLKIYTKRRTRKLALRPSLIIFGSSTVGAYWIISPKSSARLKGMLERFMEALSCSNQCFIGDEMLERLPLPSRVGKSIVGGIDLNKPRLRHVAEAVIALSASPGGFTASRTGRSGPRPRQSKLIRLRSSPSSLRSEEAPRQTDRPSDRFDPSLRAAPVRSAGDHRPARASRQSHQTTPRRSPGNRPNPRRTEPATHIDHHYLDLHDAPCRASLP